ncbi:MAG: hypothetical protein ACXU9Z_14770, partial [Gemmatimonadaceae bacterium]
IRQRQRGFRRIVEAISYVNDSGSAAVELQLVRCFAFARRFSTIDGGALQKGDAKVKRSTATVNGVSSRAKRNARELYRPLMVPAASAGS